MRRLDVMYFLFVLLTCSILVACVTSEPSVNPKKNVVELGGSQAEQHFLWLEEIEGKRALGWVNRQNEQTLSKLGSNPLFSELQKDLLEVYNDKNRVDDIYRYGDYVYNLLQDEQHVRGLLRRMRKDDYGRVDASWEPVLDVDELARKEGEDWVLSSSVNCLAPKYDRCLFELSRGGKDAVVVREFDIASKRFVAGGFELPEAKSFVAWIDQDQIMVGTRFDDDAMTESGYPRVLKMLKRGQSLQDARSFFTADKKDVLVSPFTVTEGKEQRHYVMLFEEFYRRKLWEVQANGSLTPVKMPVDAEFQGVVQKRSIVRLRSALVVGGKEYKSGSIIAGPKYDVASKVELIYEPPAGVSVRYVFNTKDFLFVVVLERVQSRVLAFQRTHRGWKKREIQM
ncbi:MAG: hypothetical protein AAGJ35_12700, partial [Myxococcota bacterium]